MPQLKHSLKSTSNGSHGRTQQSSTFKGTLGSILPKIDRPLIHPATKLGNMDKTMKPTESSKVPKMDKIITLAENSRMPKMDKTIKPTESSKMAKMDQTKAPSRMTKMDQSKNLLGESRMVPMDRLVVPNMASKSTYTAPRDQYMAARQTMIDTLSPAEKAKQERWAIHQLRLIGICPSGYDWIRQRGGFRCSAGGHWVSDASVASGYIVVEHMPDRLIGALVIGHPVNFVRGRHLGYNDMY
jgi:hypothetical protein